MTQLRTLTTCLTLCLLALPCYAQQPADFEAKLELYRNGKLTGEMTFQLESDDQGWVMASETKGVRGLAKFLGLHEQSTGEGDWFDGAARPLRYQREVSLIKTLEWHADFDWEHDVATTVYPDGESTLSLTPDVLDESALGMAVRAGLARGEEEWHFKLLDEDKIENAHFRVSSVESLQTPLGCIKVHVVEKVRGEGSKRYTRTYYADDHAFAPVWMEHGKTGGEHIEGRVVELAVEGNKVRPAPDCGATRSS